MKVINAEKMIHSICWNESLLFLLLQYNCYIYIMSYNTMQDSRLAFLREVAIDKCLRGPRPISMIEIMDRVYSYLAQFVDNPSVKRNTIIRDLRSIRQRWNVEIEEEKKGKVVYYHYKDPFFSIYKSQLKIDDLEKLNETIRALKKYVGLPHCAWVENVNAILHAYAYDNNDERPIVTFSHNPEYADNLKHFTPLFNYIRSKSAIVLKYKRFNSEEVSTRILHPYRLKEFQSRWYVVGWCKEHFDHPSCYGLERIIDFTKSDETYLENPGFDIDEYFRSMVGLTIYDGTVPQDVLIWVDNNEYPYIKSNPIHQSQKLVREVDDGKIISLHLYVNYELEMRLLAYGERVAVLSPVDLNQRLTDRLEASINNYRKKRNLLNEKITENLVFQQ